MLRPSRPEDMEEIIEIWLLASLQAHDFVDASCWWQAQEDLRTRYLDRAAIWVFEERGELLGFMALVDDFLAALFRASRSARTRRRPRPAAGGQASGGVAPRPGLCPERSGGALLPSPRLHHRGRGVRPPHRPPPIPNVLQTGLNPKPVPCFNLKKAAGILILSASGATGTVPATGLLSNENPPYRRLAPWPSTPWS